MTPFRGGDPTRIGEVYPELRANFFKRFSGLGLTDGEGEDCFQRSVEAMLINFSGASFALTCPLEAYLTAIFNRKVQELYRKRKREAVRTGELPDIPIAPLEDTQLAESAERESRWYLLLRRSFAQLEDRCQQILNFTGEKKNATEIAKELKMTNANAVYQARLRCKDAWARFIEKDPGFMSSKPNRW